MGIDDQNQQIEASLKARQERLKQLEREKRKRLLLALGRVVKRETKVTSVEDFQEHFAIVVLPAEPTKKTRKVTKKY